MMLVAKGTEMALNLIVVSQRAAWQRAIHAENKSLKMLVEEPKEKQKLKQKGIAIMDKKLSMVAEIKQLIETNAAEGDSHFAGAKINTAMPVDPKFDEPGLSVRFADASVYCVVVKRMDDLI